MKSQTTSLRRFLMRADTAISVDGMVAVQAERAEAGWEPFLAEPSVESRAAFDGHGPTMFVPTAVDVVDGEEQRTILAAASAFVAVVIEDFFAQFCVEAVVPRLHRLRLASQAFLARLPALPGRTGTARAAEAAINEVFELRQTLRIPV